jgi:PAS domain S-box-containing protein
VSIDYAASRKSVIDSSEERLVPARQYEEMQQLASIVESSDDAIISETIDGTVTTWNRGAERIFGYTAQEMIGRPDFPLARVAGQNNMGSVLDQIRKGDHVDHFEATPSCKDGTEVSVSLTVSPIRNATGEIVGVSGIARDISHQKQIEKASYVSEKLAAIGRLASSIAHHINNPLAAITNLLFLLESENLSEEGRQHLATAERQLTRVAQISAQALGFYRNIGEPVWRSLSTIIDDALALHHDRINVPGLEVCRDYDSAPQFCCHPGELQQVMVNLIGNALDAMPSGGRLHLRIRRTTNWATNRRGVRITVADNGGGMKAETRQRLFEPFYTTKEKTGTGLGLWICADIVSKYDGRISMRSNDAPGRNGSVFLLFFPL